MEVVEPLICNDQEEKEPQDIVSKRYIGSRTRHQHYGMVINPNRSFTSEVSVIGMH